MPNVVITLTLTEADALKARKALCKSAELEETTANAKKVIAEYIRGMVIREERANAAFTGVEVT